MAGAGGPALADCALWAAAASAAAAFLRLPPLLLPEAVGCCAEPLPPAPLPPPEADGVGVAAGVGCWPGPPPLVEPEGERTAAPPDAADAEASVDCWPFRLRGFFAGLTLSANAQATCNR